MSFMSLFLQEAPAAVDATQAGGGSLTMLLPLLLIVLIMYFFMIRPQNKKQKELDKMLAALKKGDKVVTIGGIHGTISSVKEKTVVVKVDDNCKLEFNRTAIATVVVDKPQTAAEPKAEKKFSLFGKKKSDQETVAAAVKADENTDK